MKSKFNDAVALFQKGNVDMAEKICLEILQNQLAYTFCQVPIIYTLSKNEKNITLILNDDAKVTITGDIIDKKMSQSIFNREGRVIQIQYNINEKILFNHKA